MKAIVQDGYGSADVLELRDVEDPVVGDDEVLVQVRAAGCGPDVWHLMTGQAVLRAAGARVPQAEGARPGPGRRRRGRGGRRRRHALRAGRRGDGRRRRARSPSSRRAPADKLVRKPARLTLRAGRGRARSPGITALQALRDVAQVQPGQPVLVIGAGGGVGTLAVQIAKALGADVTGVCSTVEGRPRPLDRRRRRDRLHARGLHRRGPALGRDRRHRRPAPAAALRRALTPKGTLAIVGGDGGGDGPAASSAGSSGRRCVAVRRPAAARLVSKETQEDLAGARRADRGRQVTPVVDRTFAADRGPDAIRYLEKGHAAGKVVITV